VREQARELFILLLGAVALIAAIFVVVGGLQSQRPEPTPLYLSHGLASASGEGDYTSANFTVPAEDCRTQELTYSGAALEGEAAAPWVVFEAVTVSALLKERSGVLDLSVAPQGALVWTLAPGRYAMVVTAGNARWQYALECR